MSGALMTAQSDEWGTPQDLFDTLNAEFSFVVDVAATRENSKCAFWITKELDALRRRWPATYDDDPATYDDDPCHCWCNPPFSLTAQFVGKAVEEARRGALVVCLIKAATDTAMWHKLVMPFADEVRLIQGRLSYVQTGKSAPATFPSCIVIFRPGLPGGPPPAFSSVDRQGKPIRLEETLWARSGAAA